MITAETLNRVVELLYGDKKYDDIIAKFLTDYNDKQELKHYAILSILEKDDKQKMIDCWNKGQMPFYFSMIIKNSIASKTSPWRKTYTNRKFIELDLENFDRENENEHEINQNMIEYKTELVKTICGILVREDPYLIKEMNLFKMFFFDNKTIKQIELQTNIPASSIYKNIKKAQTLIKNKLRIS